MDDVQVISLMAGAVLILAGALFAAHVTGLCTVVVEFT